MVELYGLCTSACMQVVCRQQNLDTTEDNRNTFTHPLRTAEIHLGKYFSTADSRNKYTLQQLLLPPTAESKLHLYLTESRTLSTTHRGQQNFISNLISELNLLTQTKLNDLQLLNWTHSTWTKAKHARQTHLDYTLKWLFEDQILYY